MFIHMKAMEKDKISFQLFTKITLEYKSIMLQQLR